MTTKSPSARRQIKPPEFLLDLHISLGLWRCRVRCLGGFHFLKGLLLTLKVKVQICWHATLFCNPDDAPADSPPPPRRPWRISRVTSACRVSAGDLSEQQDTSEPFYKKTRRRTAASSRCSCTSVTTLTTVCVSPSVSISLLSAWCIAAPDRRICLLRVNWQWCMENTFGCAAGKHDIYSHKCWFLNIWIQIRSSVLDSCPIRSFSICRMNTELHSKLSAVICIN